MITTFYSQKDPKWKDKYIGRTLLKIGNSGCLLASLGMIVGLTPDLVNNILTAHNAITKDGMIDCRTAAKVLGYSYQKINYLQSETKISFPCIGETSHFKKMNYPQHFFVALKDGSRIDPLDVNPKPEPNDYEIVSFRVFLKKQA